MLQQEASALYQRYGQETEMVFEGQWEALPRVWKHIRISGISGPPVEFSQR